MLFWFCESVTHVDEGENGLSTDPGSTPGTSTSLDDTMMDMRSKKEKKTSVPEKMVALRQLLEGLVAVNIEFLKRHKKLTGKSYPSIYDVLPKYRGPSDFGIWQDIGSVAKSGVGDACDLVCWRIAELRHEGYEDVHPYVKMTYEEDGSTLTQVQVRIHDVIEDPTALLGTR